MLRGDAARQGAVPLGCYLDGIEQLDAAFFGLSAAEVIDMDPNQRLLLQVVAKALYDSGRTKEQLEGSSTGVWIGMCNSDYQDVPGNYLMLAY